jgi:hypothetical protein
MASEAGKEFKEACDHFKKATKALVDHMFGENTTEHMRKAAKSVVNGMRASLDQLDEQLEKKPKTKKKSEKRA